MMMPGQLPGYDQALERILAHTAKLPVETVTLQAALGRVLREPVRADRDQPPFDRSAMDGFAVRRAQLASDKTFHVAGSIAAGSAIVAMPDDVHAVMRIATGAALPRGADAVIPIEQAVVNTTSAGEQVSFNANTVAPFQNVHPRGADAKVSQVVVEPSTVLGPHHIGIAAAVGAVELHVSALPRVTVLTSGDEVLAPDTPGESLPTHCIRNSNGPMLFALLQSLGITATQVHVTDDAEPTLAAAREAIGRSHLVVTTGGVSVGQRDLLPWAWEKLGLEKVLHGVAIQPGKPLLVMRDEQKLVVGLPGNPVSVLATAHLFLWPVLRRMFGLPGLPWQSITLTEPTKASSKREVFRVGRRDEQGGAAAIPWQGSGDLMHTAKAQGWLRLPITDELVAAGTVVPWLAMIGD